MSSSSNISDIEEALRYCAEEPIHLIGQVQNGAALLAIDVASCKVTHASGNVASLFGEALARELWSLTASELFPEGGFETLLGRLHLWRGRGPRLLDVTFSGRSPMPCWLHLRDTHLVIEHFLDETFAPQPGYDADERDSMLADSFSRIEGCTDLESKLVTIAEEVRRHTGFDRVMIYRFHSDGSGEVAAEQRRGDWEPFDGLRYPASDIPKQARALFMINDVRLIQDITLPPVPIVGNPSSGGGPLDLSLCRYRQPAAIHVEYLRNMEVRASFVSGVVVDAKLWGMISCHHGSPLPLPPKVQVQLASLTNQLALDLAAMARESRLRAELDSARLSNKIIQASTVIQCVTREQDWIGTMMTMAGEICVTMGADGMCLYYDGRYEAHGLVPDAESVKRLGELLMKQEDIQSLATNRAGAAFPELALPESVGGFLAIPLSKFRPDMLVLFRGEEAEQIRWAGQPQKNVEITPGGARLHPRKSFTEWKETVRGQSKPWTDDQLAMGEVVSGTIGDLILTAHYIRKALGSQDALRLRLAHEESPHPVALADELGLIVFLNRAAREDPIFSSLRSMDDIVRIGGEVLRHSLAALARTKQRFNFIPVNESGTSGRRYEAASLLESNKFVGFSLRVVAG
ncbi:GAF domain-containing protein [Luteolibacter sp. LG18]|uniref:GAF domain-containing protein n=1 Tax=Luteolibacter sp. LG18 TaxID=2819286 RepID=UPI002B2B30B0|nr:hypothetical protein llg_23400 [Luteolibacter sp. LG18]